MSEKKINQKRNVSEEIKDATDQIKLKFQREPGLLKAIYQALQAGRWIVSISHIKRLAPDNPNDYHHRHFVLNLDDQQCLKSFEEHTKLYKRDHGLKENEPGGVLY